MSQKPSNTRSKARVGREVDMRYPTGWRWTLLAVVAGTSLPSGLGGIPSRISLHLPQGSMLVIVVAAIAAGAIAASSGMSWQRRAIVVAVALALGWLFNTAFAYAASLALGDLGTRAAIVAGGLSYAAIVLTAFVTAYSLRHAGAFVLSATTLLPVIMMPTLQHFEVGYALWLLASIGGVMLMQAAAWYAGIWLAVWIVRWLFLVPPLSHERIEQDATS